MINQNLKEYDYQALHGPSFERGCVRAFSRKEAKDILKKNSYRWFYLWPKGQTPWWGWTPFDNSEDSGRIWLPFLFKKKVLGDIVTYTSSRIWPIVSSLIIISLSGTFLWFLVSRSKSIISDLIWIILALYILLQGIYVGLSNSEIIVNKKNKTITLTKSISYPFDLSRSYNSENIEKIVVACEKFYDSDTSYSCYLVSMCLGEIDIQLCASTAENKIINWAKEISDYIGVPFLIQNV
ncbi:MAG: hypothetical protein JEZ07_19885 [Phycisphaerae bacterium]|nr:hypothetical protein [Phycisphaerae bacterium]